MAYAQYQDPAISRTLKFGYWYEAHESLLRGVGFWFVVVCTAVSWLFAIFNGYIWFAERHTEKAVFQSLIAQHIPIASLHESNAVIPLAVSSVFAVPSIAQDTENGKLVDFGAIVDNPNSVWSMEVMYRFRWATGETVSRKARIAPATTSVLAIRGASVVAIPEDADIELAVVEYDRIRDSDVLDRARSVRDAVSARDIALAPVGGVTRLSFSLSNASIYTVNNPTIGVVLREFSSRVAAYAELSADRLPALGSQEFETRWARALPAGLRVDTYILSSLLDDTQFSIPEGSGITF